MVRQIKHIMLLRGAQRSVSFVSLMVFFFVLFDGVLMYLAPIIMSQSGLKEGKIGLILGLSSVAGMIFDVLLSKLIRNVTYRSIFFCMLVVATSYPFFLFGATTMTMYLVAMAVWGLYYNLYNVGTLDFVSRAKDTENHAHFFGVLKVFDGLGYLVAPFFGSLFLALLVPKIVSPWVILLLLVPAYIFWVALVIHHRFHMPPHIYSLKIPLRKSGIEALVEARIWEKVGRVLLPVLILTLIINLLDSAVWTIGPMFSESLSGNSFMKGSYFMLAYTLPPLLVGWFVGRFVRFVGKKRTSVGMLFLGSVLLACVGGVTSPLFLLLIMFSTSFCFSIAWPSINSIYADDIAKTSAYHEQIESVEDLFTNMGDVLGPISAGFLAESFGISSTFLILGVFGCICTAVLYRYTPLVLEKQMR